MSLRLLNEGLNRVCAEADLFDLDYWTLNREGDEGFEEYASWDRNLGMWMPASTAQSLKLAGEDDKVLATFIDSSPYEPQIEADWISFKGAADSEGELALVGPDGLLARLSAGSGGWTLGDSRRFPRVVFSTVGGPRFTPVEFRAETRARRSPLAERTA